MASNNDETSTDTPLRSLSSAALVILFVCLFDAFSVMLICVNSSDDADISPVVCCAVSFGMSAIPGILMK